MRRLLPSLIISVLLLTQGTLYSQKDDSKNYVKIIVNGVKSGKEAKFLDSIIKNKHGIVTSRMDYRTKVYFGIFNKSSGITIRDFEGWISDVGYEVRCSYEGAHGNSRVVQLEESDCDKGVPENIKITLNE